MSRHTLSDLRQGALQGVTRLNLSEGLSTLPRDVLQLADTLEVLNLSGNALSELPDWLCELPRLQVLFCSDNRFERVPEVVGACPALRMVGFKSNAIREVPAGSLPRSLRWLILTGNQIADLPAALGERPDLEKLALAGNRLKHLPDSLADAPNLALMRLSANAFERFPDWLWTLPRLAWLALAGNPATQALEQQRRHARALPVWSWSDLQVQAWLGEGASGHIHRVRHTADGRASVAALKVFKGALTSDGWPHSEMTAGLSVPDHPGLIGVQAVLGGHPEGREGVVMPLVPDSHVSMAAPPSLASCSRDVYPPERQWPLAEALDMATHTASTLAHLHAHGWMHGDFYAHNLLWSRSQPLQLGDFGAATPFDPTDGPSATRMARIEVRAWGLWLQEVLERVAPSAEATEEHPTWTLLMDLMQRCTGPVLDRPLWAEVQAALVSAPGTRRRSAISRPMP